jgi:hypothetical protein
MAITLTDTQISKYLMSGWFASITSCAKVSAETSSTRTAARRSIGAYDWDPVAFLHDDDSLSSSFTILLSSGDTASDPITWQ